MTVIAKKNMISYGHLKHFSVVICDFLVESSYITIVLMHVSFKIHYRNNLIDKYNSYLIPRPPSWDDRTYSCGHQLSPSAKYQMQTSFLQILVVIRPRLYWLLQFIIIALHESGTRKNYISVSWIWLLFTKENSPNTEVIVWFAQPMQTF